VNHLLVVPGGSTMSIHAAQADGLAIKWRRGAAGQLSSRTLRVSTCCWKATALPSCGLGPLDVVGHGTEGGRYVARCEARV